MNNRKNIKQKTASSGFDLLIGEKN